MTKIGNKKIVVLEDDEGLALLIQKKLEPEGFEVCIVRSYKELISFIRENPDSLLILDYSLNEITGEEIISRLNAAEIKEPFLVISGHADEKIAVKMMQLGARDFIWKDSNFLNLIPPVIKKICRQLNTERELEEAQNALKESEYKLRTITDHMLDLVCLLDKQFVFQYASPSHYNIMGYETEDLVGHSVYEFLDPECIESTIETFRTAVESRKPSKGICSFRCKNGQYITLESYGSLLYNEKGGLIGEILSSRDITERIRYEEALKDNEEKYRYLVTLIPDVILIHKDGIIKFCNDASYDVFGFTKEEMIGKNVTELVYQESVADVLENIKKRMAGEKILPYELQAHKNNGDRIYISVRGKQIKFEGETAILVIISDISARKLIEESLTLRAQLLDAASDSILVLDLDGSILYANNSALKNYGFKRNEFLKLKLNQITIAENIPALEENMQQLFDSGEIVFESRHRQKNGVIVPVEIQAKLNDVNNKILILCVIKDITERKKAEETITYERELLHNLMKYIPDTIYFKDTGSRFTRINETKAKKLGLSSPDEVIGKTDFDFYPHFQALAAYDDEQNMFKTGVPIIDKLELIEGVDGQQRWITATKAPMYDANNNAVGLVGISHDITERVQNENLQKCLYQISEAITASDNIQVLYLKIHNIVMQLMPAENFFIAILNEELNLLEFPYFVDQYDSPPQPQQLGRSLTEYVLRKGTAILADEKFDEELVAKGEVALVGEPAKVWLGVPLKIDNKSIGVLVVQDYENEKTYGQREKDILAYVSEQIALAIEKKRTEEELKQYNKKLQENKILLEERTIELDTLNKYLTESENVLKETNASKDKFFSIVAHDLKSPFNGLLGFTKILVDDFDELPPEMLRGYIGNIYQSAKNVYSLIENLLEWSRIQTGRMEYCPVKMDLFEEVNYTIELLHNNSKNKEINLHSEVPKGTFVCADNNMIHSVMQNLVSNALKFTRVGGEVKILSKDTDNFIEVTVADNGIGIKESDIWKLFRIDVQHTTQGTAKEKGTGLGLILCKELIEKHGGTIRAESVEGTGTSFIFTLPKELN